MVSFDIVSLFIKVPMKDIMDLLGRHFDEDILGLLRRVLINSYFTSMESSTDKLMVWPWAHRILL
jgi:hypothetical protein